jgi:hypothetical protein
MGTMTNLWLMLGAAVLVFCALLVLVVQQLRILSLRQALRHCSASLQRQAEQRAALDADNRELLSGLRAERAHVEQLRRRLSLVERNPDR